MSDAQVTAQILAEIERAADAGKYGLSMSHIRIYQSIGALRHLGYWLAPYDDFSGVEFWVGWRLRLGGNRLFTPKYSAEEMRARADVANRKIDTAKTAEDKAQADEAIALLESWKKEGV